MVDVYPNKRGSSGWKPWAVAWLALCIAMSGAYVWVTSCPEEGHAQARFQSIKEGMTLTEVEERLGPPSRIERFDGFIWKKPNLRGNCYFWFTDEDSLGVVFDSGGVAQRVDYETTHGASLREKVRCLIGWKYQD